MWLVKLKYYTSFICAVIVINVMQGFCAYRWVIITQTTMNHNSSLPSSSFLNLSFLIIQDNNEAVVVNLSTLSRFFVPTKIMDASCITVYCMPIVIIDDIRDHILDV